MSSQGILHWLEFGGRIMTSDRKQIRLKFGTDLPLQHFCTAWQYGCAAAVRAKRND
jgi:hypothetical protein